MSLLIPYVPMNYLVDIREALVYSLINYLVIACMGGCAFREGVASHISKVVITNT